MWSSVDVVPRSAREERRDVARSARERGKTWVAVADELRERWPELTPRAALRMAHGWTQRDVAHAWSERFESRQPEAKEISRWEVWPGRSGVRPSLDTLDRLAQLYECSVADLLVDVSDFRSRDANDAERPRTASEPVAELLPAHRRWGDEPEELRERLSTSATVDERMIRLLASQADQIREVDRTFGARVAAPQIRGHLEALDQLRHHTVSTEQREPLAYLYADAATLAGWQCLDMGDFQAAWTYYESARLAAHEASRPSALAHAVAEQAYVLVDLGNVPDALQLAEHAVAVAGTAVPSLLLAWLSAVAGEVHAELGNDDACRRAFDRSAALLPADSHDPTMPYLVLDDVHLGRWRGNALAKLGDAAAIDDLRHALDNLESSFTRARAGLYVDLAHALRAAHRPGEAGQALEEADLLARQVGSARQRRRVRALRSTLRAS